MGGHTEEGGGPGPGATTHCKLDPGRAGGTYSPFAWWE